MYLYNILFAGMIVKSEIVLLQQAYYISVTGRSLEKADLLPNINYSSFLRDIIVLEFIWFYYKFLNDSSRRIL